MRGTWIEIKAYAEQLAAQMSSLMRGTWIEISCGYERSKRIWSSLMRGTWIEMLVLDFDSDIPKGRPSCEGRGLKFRGTRPLLGRKGRPSCEGRGLK